MMVIVLVVGCKKHHCHGRKHNSIPGSAWIKVGTSNLSSDSFNPIDSFPPTKKRGKSSNRRSVRWLCIG